MAINNNPFDAQPPAAPAPAPAPAPSGGLVGSALPASYKPATRSLDPATQTVSGQVNSILAQDSPLMQRARTLALQQANQRGLVNSSLAVGAAQDAVIGQAMPMAQQDANAYNQADSQNLDAVSRASEFNTGAQNQFGLQGAQNQFAATQQDKQNQFATSERQGAQSFQGQQQTAQNQYATGERLGTEQFQQQQQGAQNDQQLKVLAQQQANTLEQMGFSNKLATAQVPAQFAATTAAQSQQQVNTIMADPNLTPEAKKQAIANVVNYTNSTLAWAEKFYNTPITPMTIGATPGAPAPTAAAPAPAPAAVAPAPAPATATLGSTGQGMSNPYAYDNRP